LNADGLSDEALVAGCRTELSQWFGAERAAVLVVRSIQRLSYCQMPQPPHFNTAAPANQTTQPGLLLAGDYTEGSSIDGAMRSGEKAARLVLRGRVET
jgi:predicted NAD/FAD-dependent oxidoreductase